jgi:polyamine oxidase
MQSLPNFNKSRRNFIQLSALVAASFPLWSSCQNNSQAISENVIILVRELRELHRRKP